MAFESSMEQTRAVAVTRRQIFTPSMEMPEKLPMDQLWRFTILESSAKVTIKSVAAEQIYPIMIPLTTNMDI